MAPYDAIAQIPGAVGYVFPDVEIEIVDQSASSCRSGRKVLFDCDRRNS